MMVPVPPGSRPAADGGTRDGELFESFPDPLLAYADGGGADRNVGADAADGPLVARRVNAAFEAAFDVDGSDATGTPLDDLRLRGSTSTDRDGDVPTGNAEPIDATIGGDDTTDAGGTDPGDAVTAGSLLARALETERDVPFGLRTDGRTRHFRVRAVDDDADGGGYLLFADVTDLERERRELAGAVERLERIASVASHDLRNPLEVAAIRLEAARDTGEEVHFEKVAGALDRIEHIVRDVLAVGGGGVDPTDAVPLGEVAEAAWETVDTTDAALVVSPELPTVRGDADRLRGLFENLFRNSVEHGDREVTVTVEPVPDGFAVADDGPGIPPDVRERAFEVGHSTVSGNSGLGLSIVERIAREHGWRVSLASGRGSSTDVDGGARFEFTGVERVEDRVESSDPGERGDPSG